MRVRIGLVVLALALFAGCSQPAPQVRPLVAVEALPAPTVPGWISEISPLGSAPQRAQIRVIFADPVLPVEQLGSARERNVLSHFSVAPAIPGGFVVLTPRMIGFQSDDALPPATRVRVTLSAGLSDLQGHRLDRDLAWTFSTPPLALSAPEDVDGTTPAPVVGLQPAVRIRSNAELDAASLVQHTSFRATSGSQVAATATLEPSPAPDTGWVYDVKPASALQKATQYELTVDPGVAPARGNVPLAKPYVQRMTTYAPLAFAAARPTADPRTSTGTPRFAGGDPALIFNNALDPKQFAAHVHVSPKTRAVGQLYSLSDDGNAIQVNPYALAPHTSYTFTFDPQLPDVFGQTLGKNVRAAYRTGALAPYFWAPFGTNTFVSTQNLKLQYSAINLPGNRYRAAYRVIQPAYLANHDVGSVSDALPTPPAWAAAGVPHAQNDRQSTIDVPLRAKLGGSAGLLFYGATAQVPNNYPYYGAVQLTNLGVFAQWFPQSGTVFVQRLSDGAPVASANVDVYVSHTFDESPSFGNSQPCASAPTRADGTVSFTGNAIDRCYAGNRPADQAPELLVVARYARDWSYVRVSPWSGIYDYGTNVDGTWSSGQPISRGTIYSDRDLYQPGERAWLTAVCYVLQNGTLRGDPNARYSVVLRDPQGGEKKLPAQTTNRYATFSFPIDFSKTQPLGYYTIVATGPQGAQVTGSFRVAEFRPPNFSVNLSLDKKAAATGETVTASGSAQYLFGAPMAGAAATIHVTRAQATLAPKGWDDFTFGRQWFWPEQQPDVSADVLQQSVTLDAQGKSSSQIPVGKDLPYAMDYRVDLEVTDASHLASSATQSFTALPGPAIIGLRSDFVGTVGAPISVAAIVTDAQGNAQTGSGVHVELQKMDFSGVTQIVEGSEEARNQVKYVTVAQADLTSGAQPQNVTLTAKEPGSYRIRANFTGAPSDASATDTQVWVSGPGQAQWGDQNPSQLQLKLDKDTYGAGQTATVAVASPYQRADLYLFVVRDRVLYRTLVHVNGTAPRVRVPITPSMFPNAAVEGVLVRRGAAITNANVADVNSLVRIGMVPLALDTSGRTLSVTIHPQRSTLEPGQHQQVRLQLRDSAGKPVRGQFTVMVVNDAILQLNGYRPPDLAQTVFAAQPISTRFADNRPNVTLAQPSDVAQKGWGYGGGFLAGAAGTRVRTQFMPLAYFKGSVETAADGTADVSFNVPDNLTTWRVMAVAMTAGNAPRFGKSDATFITTKPLVTDPLLPQFARTGDRFDAGIMLMNGGKSSLQAQTEGTLTGALSFASPAPSQTITAQQTFGTGLNAWRFPIVAGTGSSGTVQFRTAAGGNADAFRVPLEIRNADVTETVIDAGATQSEVRIPLSVERSGGTVRIDVAGSLLSQVEAPARRALDGDQLPLLTPVASRLSIAASVFALQNRLGVGNTGVNPKGVASDALTQLGALQQRDGGFGYWPGSSASDAFASADAVRALAYARDNGIAVNGSLLSRAKPYLVRVLGDPTGAAKWCTDPGCKAALRLAVLRALAAVGDRRTDFLQSIYATRDRLTVPERVQLALYLRATPGWSSQAATVASEVSKDVYVTGRYTTAGQSARWSGSQAEAQAAYLQLLLAKNAPAADRDRAARALLSEDCRCGWPDPGDTAAALEALVAYGAAERTPPNFNATLSIDGKTVGSSPFHGYASGSKTFTIASPATGSHTISLRKDGSGTLRYVLTYTYPLGDRAPGRLAGLRVSRTLRAANETAVLATFDLAPIANPVDVPAGNVYDVAINVVADHPVNRVVVTDPLPAGFEALDTSFLTTAAYYQPLASDWQIDYQQIYSDRVVAYASHLDPGVYTLHYLARSVTPGTYLWPGTDAYLLGAPEQFGRSAFATAQVR